MHIVDFTYLSILVGGLLPLLGHGLGLGLGEHVDDVEDTKADKGELGDLEEDLEVLALGGHRARAVGSEGDPVG